MSIIGTFSIGRLALAANSEALRVASHNVANINTPGFTRQEAVFSTTLPENGTPGQVGTGVEISRISRTLNKGVEGQLTNSGSDLGRFSASSDPLARIEATLANVNGDRLGQSLTKFFNAIRDVSNQPDGGVARSILLDEATALSNRFEDIALEFGRIQNDIEREVQELLSEVNIQATQIAELNTQIQTAVLSGQQPNDLLDRRAQIVNDLAAIIDVTTIDGANGELTVLVAQGVPLVSGTNAGSLDSVVNLSNGGTLDVRFNGSTVVTNGVSSGKISGLLNVRDTILPPLQKQVDQLAATVINEVNQQHRLGFGLDGVDQRDFFAPIVVASTASSQNTGTGAVAAVVSTPNLLTFDDYELSFAGGNYTVTNLDSGASTTAAYVDPTVVDFEGIQLTISGAPLAGDTFAVSAHDGAAAGIAVAITNTDEIAVSSTAGGVPGNNLNALALVNLQNITPLPLGGSTLNAFSSGISGSVGSSARANQQQLEGQEILHEQIQQMRQSVSGVSLDEELVKLIQFQMAFQAAAKIINTADEMFETLINLKQ